MQIKTMDGVIRDVSATEVEHAYHSMHKSEHSHVYQVQMDHFIKKLKKQSCEYKEKASDNIKRVAHLQSYPTTQDDVKSALTKVLHKGTPACVADVIYQAIQFEAARYMSHLMSKFME